MVLKPNGQMGMRLTRQGVLQIKEACPNMPIQCECCESLGREVRPTNSRTAYFWNHTSGEEDPNLDLFLCEGCTKQHHEEMDDRWAEYYADRI